MKGLLRASIKTTVLYGFTKTPSLKPWLMAKGKPGEIVVKASFSDFKTVTDSGRTPFDNTELCIVAVKERSGSGQSSQIMDRLALPMFLERFGELT